MILKAEGLSVHYGARRALDGISLSMDRGEVVALIGPNGAGKSSLLRVLGLLERPSAGSLSLFGAPVRWDGDLLPLRRRVVTVFADPLLLSLSARENVALGLRLRGAPAGVRDRRVRRWLDRLGVGHVAGRPASSLSSGESRRVSLARAFVLDPELLLLDEPFAALDQPTRESLLFDLGMLFRETGVSTLLVTHDRSEALALGHRLGVLIDGRLLQVDRPETLLMAPASEEVARFVGLESILPGRVVGDRGGLLGVEVAGQTAEVVGEALPGERVLLCLRPHDFTLSRPGEAPATSARNHLMGRVASLASAGVHCRVTVDCGVPVVTLITRQSAEALGLQAGTPVVVTFKATAPHVIRHGHA